MTSKLSIIVPVYNVEHYLSLCLDSILNQLYRNIEILLINDGSTDNSWNICKKYQEKDSRIKCFIKENGGASSARNYGLKKATGDYITFVDSDDTVSEDIYSSNMRILKNNTDIDFLIFPSIFWYKSPQQYLRTHEPFLYKNKEKFLKELYYTREIAGTVCNKIFKRKLFDNISFEEGMIFEDRQILTQIIDISKCIYHSNCGLYYYWARDGSSLHREITTYRLVSLCKATISVLKLLRKYDNLAGPYMLQFNELRSTLKQLYTMDKKEATIIRSLYKDMMPSFKTILSCDVSTGLMIIGLKTKIFGL